MIREINEKIEAARDRARAFGVDRVVRTIAFSGTVDGPNARADFDGRRFEATDGAGTNSARVTVPNGHVSGDNVLYSASDYGRFIEAFRDGAWVHRAIDRAHAIERELREAEERRHEAAAREASTKFDPYNA